MSADKSAQDAENGQRKRLLSDDLPADEREVRHRAGSSDPQARLHGITLNGLIFVSQRNKRNRSYIPSTNNFFGGVQVKKVLCDSGCSSILLPIEDGQLSSIFDLFPGDKFAYSIEGSNDVGGRSPVLIIQWLSRELFKVEICKDIIGHDCKNVEIKRLRFSLCSKDIKHIINTPEYSERFYERDDIKWLNDDVTSNPERDRRTHALLGQSILSKVSSVRYSSIEFFFDSDVYPDLKWAEVKVETMRLKKQLNLPESFDDWEDDDNMCLDDGMDAEDDNEDD